MSQISGDVKDFFGIVSDVFDGKASLTQAGQRLGALGTTISTQVKNDVNVVEGLIGPEATAAVQSTLSGITPVVTGALGILDDDIAPYFAGAAKVVEGGVDTVMNAALPGTSVLNPVVNAWMDNAAAGLKAAVDAQFAAWKAKLAANATPAQPAPPAPPAPAPAAPAGGVVTAS